PNDINVYTKENPDAPWPTPDLSSPILQVEDEEEDDDIDELSIMYQPRQQGNIRKQAYHATLDNLSQGSSFHTAFNAAQERVHQRDLPLAPTSEKGLNTHQYRQEFIEAKNLEFHDLARRDTFILTPRKKANLAKLVPIKWVYTYKTDENGFFVKCRHTSTWRCDSLML
ncbi:hypothetical protein V500_03649, partial [Pseudogymnoascus sp. VKM F-4518 (FW-2643)]